MLYHQNLLQMCSQNLHDGYMQKHYLEFEKPVADLEGKIQELRAMSSEEDGVSINDEVTRLETRAGDALRDIYANLTPWQKTQVARHPDRPHCLDYVNKLITDFSPLAGDRSFGEDHAIIAGLGRFKGQAVAVLGQEKGILLLARRAKVYKWKRLLWGFWQCSRQTKRLQKNSRLRLNL